METLCNFQSYPYPKKGLFNITTDEYKFPDGWVLKREIEIIIGETDDTYVNKLIESEHGEWVGNTVVKHKYILPIGIHKSRFIEWQESQLSLF